MLAPRFLDGPQGRMLAVAYRPAGADPPHWVLVVPPLFEELNKCRRTLSLLGQTLANQGSGCLVPDLLGTGDSDGALRDATWETWMENLSRARDWLAGQGARAPRVDLLAVRAGALLAWDWLAAGAPDCGRLILWQPVATGRQLVNQLLRLRLAAGLLGPGTGETAATLRGRLDRDRWIEIAGYGLPADLIANLEASALSDPGERSLAGVSWYQVVSAPEQALPPAALSQAASWSAAGLPTELTAVVADAFWATQEIVEGRALVAATAGRLAGARRLADA
jgi:uncharacterized protein